MKNLKIETFIGRQYYSNFPEVITDAVPITNPLAVEKAQNILEENEGDYLCGFVSLIYNNVVIFGEEQITESLLETWSDLFYIFNKYYDGRNHGIVFLDNAFYNDTVIQEVGEFYEIQLDCHQRFLVPIELFKNEVKKEFFKFVEFCKNEKLQFSEESSYRGLLETYDELLQLEDRKI
ncbi:hypothetical protein ACIQ1H_08640 [Lysinibacillus sp. NPDC097279]|uniref:hypothetical protein n=1 Tax=Lysinibacillus sp. NPDC097279 TaxID=3364143 RepID=UPI00380A0A2B